VYDLSRNRVGFLAGNPEKKPRYLPQGSKKFLIMDATQIDKSHPALAWVVSLGIAIFLAFVGGLIWVLWQTCQGKGDEDV